MDANTVKLQVRMDRSLKDDAEEIFAQMGLDTTTAVRIFFTKVARTRSIPFRLSAEPEFTPAQEARILEAWEEAKNPANLSKPYTDVAEMFRDIHRQIAEEEVATAPITP